MTAGAIFGATTEMPPLRDILTPEKALIFRITHRTNVPWILANGLHCARSGTRDDAFVSIGDPDLIAKRRHRVVPITPGGTLEDYVPFYFTPLSPMLLNIATGYRGIQQRSKTEIVVLVSSLSALSDHGVEHLFTDRHAYLATATFFDDDAQVAKAVDYPLLRRHDFRHDPEEPQKSERYQAEALAYRYVPAAAILGIGCYTDDVTKGIRKESAAAGGAAVVVCRPEWYFE
jgi:hypothetical protein